MHRLGLAVAIVAVVGCGSTNGSAGSTTAQPTSAASVSTPSPTTPAPSAAATSTATAIVPPSLAIEAPLDTLWTYEGTPAGEPWAPTIDPQGRIWVAAIDHDAFWILDRDGKLVETWGTAGSGDGQLAFAGPPGVGFGAVAFGPDGFAVADTRNHRVQLFDKDRTFVRAFGSFGDAAGKFVTATGIAIDQHGNVFVDDNDRLAIDEFDASGAYKRTFCPDASGPIPAVDGDGDLYCLATDRLDKFDPMGERILSVDLHAFVTLGIGLTIAPDGHVFVASVDPGAEVRAQAEHLLELDANGTLLHVWPTGGEGIAIDPAGDRIYIASADLHRVRAYALPGD